VPTTGTIQSDYLDIDWQKFDDCYYVEIDIPTPPFDVTISGPRVVEPNTYPWWTAEPSGGTPPYSYHWEARLKRPGEPLTDWYAFGHQQTEGRTYSTNVDYIELKVTVTDANRDMADVILYV
jgi:hypothetical protein